MKTTADEWYDEWLARTVQRARSAAFREKLERERLAVSAATRADEGNKPRIALLRRWLAA